MNCNVKSAFWLMRASKFADKVIAREQHYADMSQADMQEHTKALINRVNAVCNKMHILNEIMVDTFAMAAVASKRVTGLNPYKVQIMGGLALHEGSIAELKTGEGKTLLVALPAFLHALTGEGVHVVTVNPYLTKRDCDNIGRIFEYLGLTVGAVLPDMSTYDRKKAYACDVTYVSNTELGFDYLRDNMAVDKNQVCQRGLAYAIVDEVDSILIDDAKTPLIIAGKPKDVSPLVKAVDVVVSRMTEGAESREFNKSEAYLGVKRVEVGDFIVHEKDRNVLLTADGIKKIEKAFGLSNYADEKNADIQHCVEQALHAHCLMKKGKDYVVKAGKVQIVDEFTGRVMDGRTFSDGLHQAIEAKEHVHISPVNVTVATTTYQNFFRKYNLLSGMTGTAATERKEFYETYNLKVRVIPTNKPMIRKDDKDVLFLRNSSKLKAVVSEIQKAHAKGQPVLAGTASVASSQALSDVLDKAGIKHETLNAVQDGREAEIIAKAGTAGAVTVATNMAGRGTDIILDDAARKAGGLLVIGTEKHEAERIDNQLRGRSGRQGDPGRSIFLCSTEDRVMRLYGSDRFKKQLSGTMFDNDDPIPIKSIMRAIRTTQHHVELDDFAQRQNTLEYDDVNDTQREQIYKERRRILSGDDISSDIKYVLHKWVMSLLRVKNDNERLSAFNSVCPEVVEGKPVKANLIKAIDKGFSKLDKYGESFMRQCMLVAIDSAWAEHLTSLDYLRGSVSYTGYGQRDSKAVYAHEAYKLYSHMQELIYAICAQLVFDPLRQELDKTAKAKSKLASHKRKQNRKDMYEGVKIKKRKDMRV